MKLGLRINNFSTRLS